MPGWSKPGSLLTLYREQHYSYWLYLLIVIIRHFRWYVAPLALIALTNIRSCLMSELSSNIAAIFTGLGTFASHKCRIMNEEIKQYFIINIVFNYKLKLSIWKQKLIMGHFRLWLISKNKWLKKSLKHQTFKMLLSNFVSMSMRKTLYNWQHIKNLQRAIGRCGGISSLIIKAYPSSQIF